MKRDMVSGIIVAAGKGRRFNSSLPKQYQTLAGRPVLSHCLGVFAACRRIDKIVLVAAESDLEYCRKTILPEVSATASVRLISGGLHRQDSVHNGLQAVSGKEADIVVIHDGARPFVSADLIERCLDGLAEADGCIAALPAGDTLKMADDENCVQKTLDRKNVWLAQTPQVFRYAAVLRAHQEARRRGWTETDDACLLEKTGGRVKIVPGDPGNIKITTADDLRLAEAIARENRRSGR